jgi:RNA polymerase sigma-70 factor, ECF subfamily
MRKSRLWNCSSGAKEGGPGNRREATGPLGNVGLHIGGHDLTESMTHAGLADVIPLPRRFSAPGQRPATTSLERRAIASAKQGDWDAIHFLYVRYSDDVRSYVRSIVKDHHDAEDITQSLFTRLIQTIRKYEAREVAFIGWLLRVARNAALDHLRAKRQIPVEDVRVDDHHGHHNFDRSRSLRDAFEQLPGDQRTVLVMRHVVGLSPTEIAERLNKSEGSIHGLHHRGRKALQATLREMEVAPVSRRARR